jgi:hypothetical protein
MLRRKEYLFIVYQQTPTNVHLLFANLSISFSSKMDELQFIYLKLIHFYKKL